MHSTWKMPYKRKYRSYRKSRRGKYGRSRRGLRRTMAKVATKVLMKKNELKYYVAGAEAIPLYHNRGDASAGLLTSNQGALIWNPWALIQQGTTSRDRIASEIWPRGIGLRLHYEPFTDRMATHVRIIVCTIPKSSTGSINTGSNFNLMDAGPGVPNNCLIGFRKDDSGIKVMYDKVFYVKQVPLGTGQDAEGSFFKRLYIKNKRGGKVIFESQNNIVNKPLAVYVIPYDIVGTQRSDTIARCSYMYKLYFRDV